MLDCGSQRWQLVLFAIPAMVVGFRLWNGTGEVFGIGQPDGRVSPKAMWVSLSLFVGIALLEIVAISR